MDAVEDAMVRTSRSAKLTVTDLSERIGAPVDAQRFTVNIAADVAGELRGIATKHRVSESSVVEIALRQLFRRVGSRRSARSCASTAPVFDAAALRSVSGRFRNRRETAGRSGSPSCEFVPQCQTR